jgi:hypothetical protein
MESEVQRLGPSTEHASGTKRHAAQSLKTLRAYESRSVGPALSGIVALLSTACHNTPEEASTANPARPAPESNGARL